MLSLLLPLLVLLQAEAAVLDAGRSSILSSVLLHHHGPPQHHRSQWTFC